MRKSATNMPPISRTSYEETWSILYEFSTKRHEVLSIFINDKWNGRTVFGVRV